MVARRSPAGIEATRRSRCPPADTAICQLAAMRSMPVGVKLRVVSVAERAGTDRGEAAQLASEQAALRRVATLVAEGATPADVFAAVAQEVAHVVHLRNAAVCRFDDDGTVVTVMAACDDRPHGFTPGTRWPLDGPSLGAEILRTGRPARVENYDELDSSAAAEARRSGLKSVAASPIIVDGRLWGFIATSSPDAPLADDVEDRLTALTELVATAIANSQAREELSRAAREQAALRRVATLVAAGAPAAELF